MNENQPQANAFDFSRYYVQEDENNTISPNKPPLQEINASAPFDFSKFYVKEEPTRNQEILRNVARTGSRIVESTLGFPGDVVGMVQQLNEIAPKPPSFLKQEPSFIEKGIKKGLEALPKSSELKDFSSWLTSGYTDPQGPGEELSDEAASLAGVLINPVKAIKSVPAFLKQIGSAFGKATAVKGAGKGAELLGADESTKNKIELGTLFLSGFLGKKTADKFISQKYEKARSLIPEGTIIYTHDLTHSLGEVEKELAKGLSTATKDEVRKTLSELKTKASTGVMEAEELVESFHNINEKMNAKKLFDDLSSSERKLLKRRYDLVKDEVEKEIGSYGKHNTEFYKTWKEANDGYSAIAKSKKVSDFIQSKAGKLPKHLAASVALDLFLKTPIATLGVGGVYSLVKVSELLYRISRSPTLRDHYLKLVMEASNENLPGVIKHLNALDKATPKKDSNLGMEDLPTNQKNIHK